MAYQSYSKIAIIKHTLSQMTEACDNIIEWNILISQSRDYVINSRGLEVMAASCMMIETIGEAIKKIDKLEPEFLICANPKIQWKNIKGLRDHIAHGYFKLDEEIIYDVVKNEIPKLRTALIEILNRVG